MDRRLRLIAALVFAAGTIAMVVAEERDLLLLLAALLFAATTAAAAFALLALATRRRRPTAALVIGLLAATPIPWSWGPHDDNSGWVALWETPRLIIAPDAEPLLPYVSDTDD